jgi:amino acid transporter
MNFLKLKNKMKESKSKLIRIISNIILLSGCLFCIIFSWGEFKAFDEICVIVCLFMIYIMIYAPIYAHTKTKKEIDETEGDFLCDC